RQIVLQDIAAHGVGAWLENRPQPRTRVSRTKSGKRSGNSRRMVRKVVNDRDTVDLRAHLEASLHALEGLKRCGNFIFRDSVAIGEGRRRGGVPDVIFAAQSKLEIRPRFTFL